MGSTSRESIETNAGPSMDSRSRSHRVQHMQAEPPGGAVRVAAAHGPGQVDHADAPTALDSGGRNRSPFARAGLDHPDRTAEVVGVGRGEHRLGPGDLDHPDPVQR